MTLLAIRITSVYCDTPYYRDVVLKETDKLDGMTLEDSIANLFNLLLHGIVGNKTMQVVHFRKLYTYIGGACVIKLSTYTVDAKFLAITINCSITILSSYW